MKPVAPVSGAKELTLRPKSGSRGTRADQGSPGSAPPIPWHSSTGDTLENDCFVHNLRVFRYLDRIAILAGAGRNPLGTSLGRAILFPNVRHFESRRVPRPRVSTASRKLSSAKSRMR